jgi:hypothetical protein
MLKIVSNWVRRQSYLIFGYNPVNPCISCNLISLLDMYLAYGDIELYYYLNEIASPMSESQFLPENENFIDDSYLNYGGSRILEGFESDKELYPHLILLNNGITLYEQISYRVNVDLYQKRYINPKSTIGFVELIKKGSPQC